MDWSTTKTTIQRISAPHSRFSCPDCFSSLALHFLMQAAMVNTGSVLGVVCMLTSGYTRLMFGKKTDPTLYLQQNIEDIRNEIEQNFGKFPDVKTYLKDFDDEYARIQAIKAKTEKRIKRIKYILYGIIIGAILIIIGIDKPVMT